MRATGTDMNAIILVLIQARGSRIGDWTELKWNSVVQNSDPSLPLSVITIALMGNLIIYKLIAVMGYNNSHIINDYHAIRQRGLSVVQNVDPDGKVAMSDMSSP
jgi:hypothetical protein